MNFLYQITKCITDSFKQQQSQIIQKVNKFIKSMIQFEDKKGDIYQILSFCLGHLKRKILLLLKIFLNDKIPAPSTQLITELAKQQSASQQYISLLHQNRSIISKEDQILYQRFVCRIKQLIRNYLPHASVSHELFVFLKKIETYSFKPNYQFEDYILYILVENPPTLVKIINQEMRQLKRAQTKRNSSRRYDKFSPDQTFSRLSPSKDFKKFSLILSSNLKPQLQTLDYQSTRPTEIENNRPIDIFNKSIKPVMDCLDCDISIIRGVYFNLQKQKQSPNFSKRFSDTFTISKGVRDIEQEMLGQNRFIKDTITFFDKQYTKYSIRLEKQPDFYKKQRKRCQTANGTRRKHNFSLLPDQTNDNFSKNKARAETKKKFQTIMNYPSEQEKQQLYKEIQKRKNTVLKMKSISISANKGHLELCSQTRDQSKKLSLTFSNLKRAMNRNNSRNMAVNLKKKYEIFMSNMSQKHPKQPAKQSVFQQSTLTITPTNRHHPQTAHTYNTIAHSQNISWLQSTPINLPHHLQHDIEIELSPPNTKHKQTIITDHLQSNSKNIILRRQINSRLSEDKNKLSQTMGKFSKVHQEFENTIKNVMKGGNVNHRNYAGIQHREKRLFETLNPELTVKTIRKGS